MQLPLTSRLGISATLQMLSSFDLGIWFYQQAASLIPDGHPYKAKSLNNLRVTFHSRFNRFSGLPDLDNAIKFKHQAVNLTPDGYAEKAQCLSSLGLAFQSRFECLEKLDDINNAIKYNQEAVNLTPDGYVEKAQHLNNLGTAFHLTPDDLAKKAQHLCSLGLAFHGRFKSSGDLADVNNAIRFIQQGVNLTSHSYAGKAGYLSNLELAFQSQFEHSGKPDDIDNAIKFNQEAVNLTPNGHADKALYLSNLGIAFQHKFMQFGALGDINSAIEFNQQACQFEHLGKPDDINNAIRFSQQAVNLTPNSHANKAQCFSNLGIAFQSQFNHLGEIVDIDKAIVLHQQAVNITLDGHAGKAKHLGNLANAFQDWFKNLHEDVDINNAIVSHQQAQAANLTPDSHAEKAQYLNHLGGAFWSWFEHLGEHADIDNAIAFNQQALKLTPKGHTGQAGCLNNLGVAFHSRFTCIGKLIDIENSIGFNQQAVDLTPDDYACKAQRLSNLGEAFKSQFDCLGKLADIDNVIASYSRAAKNDLSSPSIRCHAALHWVSLCSQYKSSSLTLDSYRTVLEIIPQYAWLGQKVTHRYQRLSTLSGIVNAAAAMAIYSGEHDLALEWLEEGHSIVWGQILQLGSPIDDLQLKNVVLADELEAVSCALESVGTSRIISPFQDTTPKNLKATPEEEAQTHWALATRKIESILQDNHTYNVKPHITWCATGLLVFLPLHAAGIYGSGDFSKKMNMFHFAVSSYTPTIMTLLHPPPRLPVSTIKLLIISQPNTPCQPALPGTAKEAKAIQMHILPGTASILHLNHKEVAISTVLEAMSQHDWIHLACHGIQDTKDPIKSAFALYDGKLELESLMGTYLSNGYA
ncbi:hypothetical protein M422DRAFT_271146 [Sphaerobolus stellatus SS14]|uniref:CHAT domain-containing protein n=1 Tax=Sphaerobolus stellatus (strain SS14) TaxID=990650 RepID=A0A0C9UQH6_SPHS4|nr:hypothetical protein M422DRAFT_271146 [Sphaerobolus stellatus SS14]